MPIASDDVVTHMVTLSYDSNYPVVEELEGAVWDPVRRELRLVDGTLMVTNGGSGTGVQVGHEPTAAEKTVAVLRELRGPAEPLVPPVQLARCARTGAQCTRTCALGECDLDVLNAEGPHGGGGGGGWSIVPGSSTFGGITASGGTGSSARPRTPQPRVDPETGVPWCSDADCPHWRRGGEDFPPLCSILDDSPTKICEPAVRAMALLVNDRDAQPGGRSSVYPPSVARCGTCGQIPDVHGCTPGLHCGSAEAVKDAWARPLEDEGAEAQTYQDGAGTQRWSIIRKLMAEHGIVNSVHTGTLLYEPSRLPALVTALWRMTAPGKRTSAPSTEWPIGMRVLINGLGDGLGGSTVADVAGSFVAVRSPYGETRWYDKSEVERVGGEACNGCTSSHEGRDTKADCPVHGWEE